MAFGLFVLLNLKNREKFGEDFLWRVFFLFGGLVLFFEREGLKGGVCFVRMGLFYRYLL